MIEPTQQGQQVPAGQQPVSQRSDAEQHVSDREAQKTEPHENPQGLLVDIWRHPLQQGDCQRNDDHARAPGHAQRQSELAQAACGLVEAQSGPNQGE